MEESEEKSKWTAYWKKQLRNSRSEPFPTTRGIGIVSELGVLGYGVLSEDGTVDFCPLAFESQSRAEGMAKALKNRTTIEHGVAPVAWKKAIGIGAATKAEDFKEGEIPANGRSSRFMQSRVGRKRRQSEREQRISQFESNA